MLLECVPGFPALLGLTHLCQFPRTLGAQPQPTHLHRPRVRAKDTGQASQEAAEELQEGWLGGEQWCQGKQQPWQQPRWHCPMEPSRVVPLP